MRRLNELGVATIASGAQGNDTSALNLARRYRGRFSPFGGMGTLRSLLREERGLAWNLESQTIRDYLVELEADLRTGTFSGIGELFVNKTFESHDSGGSTRLEYAADSPLMQQLWAFSATYDVPLSVHMDATDDSIAGMERLLASDTTGTWIWAHKGHVADVLLLRRLLNTHPNLYIELSGTLSPWSSNTHSAIDDNGELKLSWKTLLEEFPGRFTLGSDRSGENFLADFTGYINFWREILKQLSSDTAAKIAHRNAKHLLGLPASQ